MYDCVKKPSLIRVFRKAGAACLRAFCYSPLEAAGVTGRSVEGNCSDIVYARIWSSAS